MASVVEVCVMCGEGGVVRGGRGGVGGAVGRGCGLDGVWCGRVCVCGVVRTCVGRCACEVCEMQRCIVEADDVCGWGVGCVCLVCARR